MARYDPPAARVVLAYLFAFATVTGLAACGGGGGGSPVGPVKPTVSSVTPASGSASGRTVVSVTGLAFSEATRVTFGGVPGTQLQVANDALLTVTTPPGAAGLADVTVTNLAGDGTLANGFTYLAAGIISTFAGTSTGFGGDGAAATAAQFSAPSGVFIDAAGNAWTADAGNHRVRVVAAAATTLFGRSMAAGDVYTVAGTTAGLSGDGGAASAAQLDTPRDVAVDPSGNVFIADSLNGRVRVAAAVTGSLFGVAVSAGNLYTVAGTSPGFAGDGGPASAAQLDGPVSLAFDSAGNLYVADSANHRIRMIPRTSGTWFGTAMIANRIYTVAGTTQGFSGDNGPAVAAQLDTPGGVACDAAGHLYIADSLNHRVRVVAASAASLFGVAASTGSIYTVAGTVQGFAGDGGPALAARLNGPSRVAFDLAGNLYVSDTGNLRIRLLSRAGNVWYGVSSVAGSLYTVAGANPGIAGDGIAAITAQLGSPAGVGFDALGELYIADAAGARIRAVTP